MEEELLWCIYCKEQILDNNYIVRGNKYYHKDCWDIIKRRELDFSGD